METMNSFLEELTSASSIEKVPIKLWALIEDIKKVVEEVYGLDNVGALYWEGSVPRGDFVPGKSDADFVLICKHTLDNDHKTKREAAIEKLEPKWIKVGVTKIDMIAMSESEIHDDNRKKQLFVVATDSVQIYGDTKYNLGFSIPETRKETAKLLVGDFSKTIERAKINDWPKWLAKMTLRAMYRSAFARGAHYERHVDDYRPGIVQFVPEMVTDFENLIKIREKDGLTRQEKQESYEIAQKVLQQLRIDKLA